jgi:hypothetical protein
MAEGSETSGGPGSEPPGGGFGPEGRGRAGEGDLLAERRARRAAESGEHLLARRAEAAEATVRTLETHVASLQQRLREAEEERMQVSELIEAERASLASGLGPRGPDAGERSAAEAMAEHELRRVKQREYAEQRQRVEAEDRLVALERETGAELEQLRRRLSDSESEAGMLAGRLEQLRRELAEVEHSLAAERAALQRAEVEIEARIAELERRAEGAERELESERAAREQAEGALEFVRAGYRKLEALVEELKATAKRLRAAAGSEGAQAGPHPAPLGEEAGADPGAGAQERAGPQRGAGAGERPAEERAGSEERHIVRDTAAAGEPTAGQLLPSAPGELPAASEFGPPRGAPAASGGSRQPGATEHNGEMVEALAAAVERLRARVAEGTVPAPSLAARQPAHKHSKSLIGRIRMRRKQRRGR